jgi:hypothetical protein
LAQWIFAPRDAPAATGFPGTGEWFCDRPKRAMKTHAWQTFRALLIELGVYAVLVTGYFMLVLHYLGGWLQHLHLTNVKLYAIVSLALIIGQAVLLESVTTWLLRFLRGRSE